MGLLGGDPVQAKGLLSWIGSPLSFTSQAEEGRTPSEGTADLWVGTLSIRSVDNGPTKMDPER